MMYSHKCMKQDQSYSDKSFTSEKTIWFEFVKDHCFESYLENCCIIYRKLPFKTLINDQTWNLKHLHGARFILFLTIVPGGKGIQFRNGDEKKIIWFESKSMKWLMLDTEQLGETAN